MARADASRRGFTLLELMIALAIAAVLAAMATPSFADLLARQRLQAVAHQLQADIALARQEAGRRGQTVHLSFHTGPGWCYALSTGAARDCRDPAGVRDSATLKVVHGPDFPGVTLVEAGAMALDAQQGVALQAGGQARFVSSLGEQLVVRLGPMGRASLCAPAAPIAGNPPCPAAAPAS